ncbi:MAG: insulinase family protein [Myxococcota bacterium]
MICAVAAPSWAGPAPHFGPVELLTFDNGLRVVLQPDPDGATVSMVARVNVGWDADPADGEGLAHLVEHLWFRRAVAGSDLWSAARSRACHSHATTAADVTRYEMRCAAFDAPFVLDQVIAGVSEPLSGVDAHQTALEVAIVDQELRERTDGSMKVTRALYSGLVAADHPVHERLADPDFDAPALSLEQAQTWAKDNYLPKEIVVSIVGGFEREAAVAALTDAFGAPVANAAPDASQGSGGRAPSGAIRSDSAEIRQSQPLPSLVLGWNLPPSMGGSALSAIAAEHLGRQLDEALQDESDVVASSCGVQAWPGAPALVCEVTLADGTEQNRDLDKRLNREIEGAWSQRTRKALRARLMRARAEAPQNLLLSHARPLARARRFADQVADRGEATPIENTIKDVRQWKPQSLLAVAPTWFSPDRASRVRVRVDPAAVATPLAPWREVALLEPVDTAVHGGGHPVTDGAVKTPDLAIRTLSTGLTLVGIHHPDAPNVMVSVRVPGGLGVGPPGLSSMAEALTTGSRSDEAWGVRSGHIVGRDYVEVYAIAPGRQLYRAVQASVRGVVMRVPMVDADQSRDDDLDRYVRRRRAMTQAATGTPAWRAERAISQAVTPNHLAGTPLSDADLTAARRIDATTLVAYLWRTYQPTEAIVFVSGPQDADQLVRVAARQFKHWVLRQGIIPAPYSPPPPAGPAVSAERVVDDPSTALGWLNWRCRLPSTPSAAERVVLVEALQMATFDELRHRRGFVYTPAVDLAHWPDGTATVDVAISGPPGRIGSALAALDEIQASVGARVAAARDRSSRAVVHRLDGLQAFESLLALVAEGNDLPDDPVAAYVTAVQAVSAEQVDRTMSACRATRSFVVRGPEAALRPGLEAHGYAPTAVKVP